MAQYQRLFLVLVMIASILLGGLSLFVAEAASIHATIVDGTIFVEVVPSDGYGLSGASDEGAPIPGLPY